MHAQVAVEAGDDMSDYAHRPGGPLKLKGAGDKWVDDQRLRARLTTTGRKKKKKSKSASERQGIEHEVAISEKKEAKAEASSSGRGKTEAERRFEEVQRQRVSCLRWRIHSGDQADVSA